MPHCTPPIRRRLRSWLGLWIPVGSLAVRPCRIHLVGSRRASLVGRQAVCLIAWLQSHVPAIIVPDPNRFGYFVDENLPISNLAGSRRECQGPDHFVSPSGRYHQLDLYLGQQVEVVFLSAIDLFVALLASVAANFADCHAVDTDALQCLFDLVEFEGLDDRLKLLHTTSLGFARDR